MMSHRGRIALLLLTLCWALAACTEEKAQALKTAAEAFRDRAVEALNAVEDLYVISGLGQSTDAQNVQRSVAQIRAAALRDKDVSPDLLKGATSWITARDDIDQHTKPLRDARQAYVDFAAAFSRLPEGSALAAEHVACATGLGARLIDKLLQIQQALAARPVPFFMDESSAEAAVAKAAKSGDANAIESAAIAYIDVRKKAYSANADARRKLAIAAISGTELYQLMQSYGTLSVADLLAGTSRVLEIRSTHLGLSDDTLSQRLAVIRDQMAKDDSIKPVLAAPAISITCKR